MTAAAPGTAACKECEVKIPADHITCAACLEHARLSRRHATTGSYLDAAQFETSVPPVSPPDPTTAPTTAASPIPPLPLDRRTLRPVDEIALGIPSPFDCLSCVEPAPCGYRIGDYADLCDNCGFR